MSSRPPAALMLTDAQRISLASLSKSQTAPYRMVKRAKVLLLAGEGVGNTDIGERVGVSRSSVIEWRRRFGKDGLEKMGKVRPGRGRKATISPEHVEAIVADTLHTSPLAKRTGPADRWPDMPA